MAIYAKKKYDLKKDKYAESGTGKKHHLDRKNSVDLLIGKGTTEGKNKWVPTRQHCEGRSQLGYYDK